MAAATVLRAPRVGMGGEVVTAESGPSDWADTPLHDRPTGWWITTDGRDKPDIVEVVEWLNARRPSAAGPTTARDEAPPDVAECALCGRMHDGGGEACDACRPELEARSRAVGADGDVA